MSGAIKTRDLVHKISLLSKFKGALVGAVVGDCLGAPFEASWDVKLEAVKRFFSQLQSRGISTSHGQISEQCVLTVSVQHL